ncbi:hypothetical protein Trydic_g8837 [Trypoxylus dichotomus]
MDTGACCVAPSAPQRSDDQIVPAHPGDCWNTHQNNHQQPFLDAWLQMQFPDFVVTYEQLVTQVYGCGNRFNETETVVCKSASGASETRTAECIEDVR